MAPNSRSIKALGNDHFKNKRHRTNDLDPVPVTEERGRRSSKRRADLDLDDAVRALGSTFDVRQDSGTVFDTPSKTTKKPTKSEDSSYVILPYGGLLNFEAEIFLSTLPRASNTNTF